MTQAPRTEVEARPKADTELAESPAKQRGGMLEVASSRAAQEVQAAMVIAKRFPRDEEAAFRRIIHACRRKTLAAQAMYAYPRGTGNIVTGPSIRLAEELARDWGNVDFGLIELDQRDGESDVMAFAWDLETNTRQTKTFTIRHERHTKRGSYALTDPRDIYELTANQGARRLRSCILGIIPGDVTEAAIHECEKTLAGDTTVPIEDRIRQMLLAFEPLNVTQVMIEQRLGHRLAVTTEIELVNLRKIFLSIRDNMAEPREFFTATEAEHPASTTDALAEKFAGKAPDEKVDPATKAKADKQIDALRQKQEAAPEGSQDAQDGTSAYDPNDPTQGAAPEAKPAPKPAPKRKAKADSLPGMEAGDHGAEAH